ncbi:MAG: PAS domain S-box protein [Betaproteobacteria bacterium]|nr:PAS domain S-box protein [Betaproteobacteria bacterium]
MTPPRQLRNLLIAGLVCTNVLVIVFCAHYLQHNRLQHELRAESLTQNVASALDLNVSGSVEKIDLALQTVADELERRLAEGKLDETELNVFLARHEQRLPEIEAIRVANADGLVILGKGLIKTDQVNWADRDYFLYHRAHADHALHVAEPRMGRVAKQYIVGFSRRYNMPDGRFAGVISAPVAISHFTQLLSRFDLGQHGVIALRNANLALITRLPAISDQAAGEVGNTSVSPELRQLVDSGKLSATYYTPTGADGYQRLVTYRRLSKAPMIVIAGMAKEDYLAAWRDEVFQTSGIAAGFLLLSVFFGIFVSRQLLKADQRENALRQSTESRERQHESLRRLNEIAALSHLPLAEQLREALAVGCRLFNLPFGIVSEIQGETYRVVSQVSPGNTLEDDQEFPLGVTYCKIALDSGNVLAIAKMAESPYAHHPCYNIFKLEAYIGTPIMVDGQVFGTVNFSSAEPYHRQFDETDTEFIALLARWVGSAIEREQAQQDLAASERHLQSIIDAEPECVKILSPDGKLLQMNRAGLTMIEADSLEHVVGRNLADIVSPNDREAFVAFNETIQHGESGSLEFEVIGLKGTHRWLETHAVPMRDNEGKITGLLGITRDITARRQADAELELHRRHLEELVQQRTATLLETEARASHIIQSSADGLYGIDEHGLITFINPAACITLGYKAEEAVGKNCHILFHHSRPDGSPYPVEQCPSVHSLQFGKTVRIDNEVYWHADGHPIPVMYSTHPMIQDGRTVGAVTSFVDMSIQRAAAEAREKALIAAENLARIRSEFLANMSHEIRTPLNGVLGFAEIGYRHYQNSEKAREAFTKIKASGTRLLGVINDVLDFSKIEAGKLRIEQTTVNIADLIDHAVELVRHRAESKYLSLSIELAPDLPECCLGDPLRMNQILLNLLSNAIKFTEKGRVALTASCQGDRLIFTVTDTGIGMSEDELATLFTPFQQADASASRRFGGTGLGLAISKRIAELMYGDVEVKSQRGVGTTVRVNLPYVPDAEAASKPVGIDASPDDVLPKPLAGVSILVAEDEVINQAVLETNLLEDGARVVIVCNGREAVERIAHDGRAAYDVVLMDIQMPVMDGYEATRQIKALAPDLPIIAQTAHAFNEERERCLAAGMVGHLAKPIDAAALVQLIRQHVPS